MARRRQSVGRELLPRSVAVLGELGPVALARELPSGEFEYFSVPWRPGRVLCSSADGRELFVLRPVAGAGPARANQQALQALDLHERFVHRRANELYNCVVPAFRTPNYSGDLAIIHYYAEKSFEDDGDEEGVPSEYVHTFEKPGERPAYVPWFSVGNGQFWVPEGEFAVTEAGIDYAPARRRRNS